MVSEKESRQFENSSPSRKAETTVVTTLAASIPGAEHNGQTRNGTEPSPMIPPKGAVALARQVLMLRKRRSRHLPSEMFGEPAWDMLLLLYLADDSGAQHSLERLTQLAGVSPSTGVRWIKYLETSGLVREQNNTPGGKASYVLLSDEGRLAVDRLLTEALQSRF